ncbi:hypothetical protein B0A48_14541 [Cryoendolithus antarcticus]|uniref:Uncharacterized protein n=1 Tax=Cryoendolithus antarcticus TaxID=1507870 RepID=A0A1V8SLL9_9PEZI|nr:hypothetical protein B0A48_14541 [Cryoendolithus antarcticus]
MDHDSSTSVIERDTDMMDTSTSNEGVEIKQEDHTIASVLQEDIDSDTEMKLEEDLPTTLLDHSHDHTSPSPFSFTRPRPNIPYNPAHEPKEIFKINKAGLTPAQQAAYLIAIKKPAPVPVITTAADEHTPDYTDILAHVRKHQKLHTRVLLLRSKERLRPGRYWIAVLPPSSGSPHAQAAKLSPMWMKGNRLTTVETVWKTYATKAMLEDFGLWLGGELLWDGKEVGEGIGGRLKDGSWGAKGVGMQECDLFGDKVVVLRAIEFGREGSLMQGKKITEGLVTMEREVIVIELD